MISEVLTQKQPYKCHEITKTTVTEPKALVKSTYLVGPDTECFMLKTSKFLFILILIFV